MFMLFIFLLTFQDNQHIRKTSFRTDRERVEIIIIYINLIKLELQVWIFCFNLVRKNKLGL